MAATVTLVSSSPDPSVVGQPVTLTATVIPIGAGSPTGTVTFVVSGGPTVTAPVVGGTATATVNNLSVGNHTVTATYSGDTHFTSSTGSTVQVVIQASTTTTVTSSPDPSTFGQTVNITATVAPVAPGAGTPTGTVTFYITGGPTLTAPLVGGTATVSTNTLSVGSHTITAVYGGSANYLASSGTDTHTVQGLGSTTTTVTSSPDPSVVGQPVTFTATVAPVAPGAGTPTGTVTFNFGDGSPPVTVALSGGTATTTHVYTSTTGSPFTVTATYSGNVNFAGSTGTDTQTVTQAATSTPVVSSPDPSVVGQSVTFTATVVPVAPGAGSPSGTVTFNFGDGSPTQSGTLVGGTATVTHAYTSTTGSPFTVTATYSGNANFAGSTGTDTQTVNQAATTTTVSSSPDPSVVGQPVTITATVAPMAPGAGTPTGTVTFNFGDGSPSQVANLVGGTATVTHAYTSTTGSPFTVTATYGGNVNFAGSSGTDTQTVNQAATTTTVSSSPDPSVVGQPVTITATVAPMAPGAGTPTGLATVSFGDGSPSQVVNVVGGTATVTHTYTSTTGSPYTITASYSGNSNFLPSFGIDTQTVNQAATSTTVSSSPDPSVVGQPVTFTATVAPVAPGAGSPSGTVTFNFGDGSPTQSGTLVGGTATVTHAYTTTTGSPFAVTATYSGNANFAGSTGSDTQTVNQAVTTTTVSSSPDPSVVGQSVTFTATVLPVAPGAGSPSGTVTFNFGDGSPTQSGTLVGGTATVTHAYTSTTGSPFTVTATYSGNANFAGSTGSDTQTVNQAVTTTTVSSSPDPSVVGQSVTFTATVLPVAPGAGSPSGTVTFNFGDGSPTQSGTLVGGTATVTHAYTSTTGSPFTVTATYSGNANFAGSTGSDTQTVNQAATTTTVSSSPDPSVVGQPVTITATVAPMAPGAGTPTGLATVSFGDGSPSQVVNVVGGTATVTHTYTSTTGSPFTVTATYSGDANFAGSSGSDTQTVSQAATSTSVVSSPDPSVVGQSVTFTATVAPVAPGAGAPSGTVTFDFGDGSPVQTVALVGGTATVTHAYTSTTGSPFAVTATYSGNANFAGSSGSDTQTVTQAATSTSVVSSPDPSVVGQSVTFTATVLPVAPGAGSPSGTVTFNFGDGSPTQSGTLVGGTATVTHAYTTTTGSPFAVTATYSGDANFAGSSGSDTQTVNQSVTSTTVSSSPDPSVVGQPVTFTATVAPVAPGAGAPSGTVTFDFGDGSPVQTVALVGGTATVTHAYTTTTGSPFAVTATYSGDANFAGSSGSDTQTVNQSVTSTTVLSSPDPSVVGQPVTFTATVAPVAPGAGAPSGTVTFDFGDGSPVQTVALVGGTATVTHAYTSTTGSPFTVTATYGGDANFAGSSGTDTQTVNQAATTTAVVSSPDPSVVGQSVTFTATVAPVAPGAGSPSGTVNFNFGDGSPSQVANLVGGTATVTHAYTTTTGSPFAVTATYSGDANFAGSSGTDTQTVTQAATSTSVVSSPDPSVVGQPVTFTATVAPVAPGAGAPSGTVTFDFGDGSPVQTVALVGGTATDTHAYTTTTGSPFTVTATYGGDANFAGSSGTDTQTVTQAATSTSVVSSPDPSVVGQPVTFTATVAPVAPGAGSPSGTVTFNFGDGSPTQSGTLVGGTATVTHAYTTTTGSPFAVTATYSGDANFAGSSGADTQMVNPAATTTALADTPDPSVVGQPVTFTATVTPTAPGAGTPSGSVVFDFGDGNVSAPVAVSGGVATTTHAYTTTTGSPFTVTVTYGGDGNFTGSVAAGSHTVNAAATTTSVFDDLPDPSVAGQPVTFVAHVTPVAPGAGSPSGSVVFDFGDGNVSAPVAVSGGVATTTHAYTTTTGSPFTVTVTYGGDGNFTGSTGAGGHTVNPAATSVALTDAPDPSVVAESVTFTATVTPVSPGAGTPSGSVVFDFGDGSPVQTVAVSGGVATTTHAYTTTSGSPFTVTATYSGDGNFTGDAATDTHQVV
ncbi:Ig-like domain repeat protein [Streptomyces sp. NBC_00582]|uniref:Ig-like domain repeat protein n=1 Tax=Streptomyces sp. NBC_00582 TaxID=2975783 RepID=UPI002E80F8EE|nr:Ig-like domain repeat protein [Streptomyces sp. NBC_00582]WUB60972.1 Ig-like domain repeat protein [Streptomyces sp. NBC_00582]